MGTIDNKDPKDPLLNGELDFNNLTIDTSGRVKTRKGQFVKGVSGNPKGRPKKVKLVDVVKQKEELTPDLKTAAMSGKAKKVMKELMKTSDNRTELKQLARELLPYQNAKRASIETKISSFKTIEFHMVLPEKMQEIEKLYRNDPSAIEHMNSLDTSAIVNVTDTAEVTSTEEGNNE